MSEVVAQKDTSAQRRGAIIANTIAPLATAIAQDKEGVVGAILQRALDGERLLDIAPDYGVSLQGLQYQLIRHAMDQWRDVQAARSLAEYEQNKSELDGAKDALELARARDKIKCSHFELERLIPRLYGQKQEVTHTHKVDLETAIQAAERRIRAIADKTIDVTPSQDPE